MDQHNGTQLSDTEKPSGELTSSSNETALKSEKITSRKAGAFIQQIGLNMLVIGVIALLALIAWQRFSPQPGVAALIEPAETEKVAMEGAGGPFTPDANPIVDLQPITTPASSISTGISRITNVRTIIPSRPRDDVITYTVSMGDTLFSIANSYNLKPETILWGNSDVLDDNPHLLKPNQVLRVLPVDGLYYQWEQGDTLSAVADEFHVDPSVVINYPGNNFDLTQLEADGANIETGAWLIIPGGTRPIKDWGPPAITRDNPATARYYGKGSCGAIYSGAFGTGTFIWPTTDRGVSGYGFDPGVHPAIDIAGSEGNPVYATDSGVIVYAGWSDYGYGLLIVIDHGNGWQSAYAHLSSVAVSCGQSVYQGGFIGGLGTTGNSSGPHLHFELVYNGVKVNPLGYVS